MLDGLPWNVIYAHIGRDEKCGEELPSNVKNNGPSDPEWAPGQYIIAVSKCIPSSTMSNAGEVYWREQTYRKCKKVREPVNESSHCVPYFDPCLVQSGRA